MKVFISWSGNKSKYVAEALRDWLPYLNGKIEPWCSGSDLESGSRWSPEIAKQLNDTHYGIICLTNDNMNAPWILFEAGALAKAMLMSNVCPYLINIKLSELKYPLAQFQAQMADKSSTRKLICDLNKKMGKDAIDETRILTLFDRFWPDLEKILNSLPDDEKEKIPQKDINQMFEEIIIEMRDIKRQLKPDTGLSIDSDMDAKVVVYIDFNNLGLDIVENYTFSRNTTFSSLLSNIVNYCNKELNSDILQLREYNVKWILVEPITSTLLRYSVNYHMTLQHLFIKFGVDTHLHLKVLMIK
ncbi:MAG: TIR domain-containing protein [Candidatus Zixiibacteriota bacterium]